MAFTALVTEGNVQKTVVIVDKVGVFEDTYSIDQDGNAYLPAQYGAGLVPATMPGSTDPAPAPDPDKVDPDTGQGGTMEEPADD